MQPVSSIAALVVLTVLAGCVLFVPKESRYLKGAEGRATQQDVERQLGKPEVVSLNEAGEVVWVYRVREEEPGNRWTSTGLWCDEYVLTFDSRAVLRSWTRRSHFHGGELMPVYCVPEGMKS
jgi:hypothetical protein